MSVAAYYDQNTTPFLRWGSGLDLGAIHRQVWSPGTRSIGDSFLTVNRLIARALSQAGVRPTERVVDLGCGVGGTLTWLAAQNGQRGLGLTISPRQARQARRRIARLGHAAQVAVVCADIARLPLAGHAPAAYAIEAFAHVADQAGVFAAGARLLMPGGRLIVIDDALSERPPTAAEAADVERFRRGWLVPGLSPLSAWVQHAAQAGLTLVDSQDLTAWLRPVPAPLLSLADLVLRAMPARSLFWASWRGSVALQRCLRAGLTRYLMAVFERPGPDLPVVSPTD